MEFKKLIEDSKKILDLKEDWDDEGALPIDEDLYNESISFFMKYYYEGMSLPDISPCRDGSIDFYWSGENQLLINISKENQGYIATFYGDNRKKVIKGTILTDEFSETLDKFIFDYMHYH